MKTYNLRANTAAGIEGITKKELEDLGYNTHNENGAVNFKGDIHDIIKTNLWLRTADRIEIVVGKFEAKSFSELFDKTKSLPWEDLLPMDAKFPVEGRSQRSQLHSVPDVQSIVKKAIVSKLSNVYHRHNRLPETGATYPLEVRINKDQVTLLLDTTGPSLFKRGYRKSKGEAPLKENMAASLIKLTNWDPKTMPLIDPMSGSGTIPIEAAMIARNIAPGFNRSFICESWNWVSKSVSDKVRADADNEADYDSKFDIYSFDKDQNMVADAKLNAQEVGLMDDIHFKQLAVEDFKTELPGGIIISNPPYGERLGDKEAVERLYQSLGKVFRPLKNWSKYFITSDENFEKMYGEKATKKRKLYNGRLKTDYYQYWTNHSKQH